MKVIGLTGGIGSGKTTVAKMFQKFDVPVYEADTEAKLLMNRSKVIKRKLIGLFGNDAYRKGALNKPFIADKIFNNTELLNKINAIIHPKVTSHFKRWLTKQADVPYVIKEVAILFENGGYVNCDAIITVIAPIKDRISRVIARDSSTVARVMAIIDNQWNDEKKVEMSQYVITNKSLVKTQQQVEEIHQKILKSSC